MFKVAQFGAGRIGIIHARNIAAHPGLALACIVDPAAEAAGALAAATGTKVATAEEVYSDPSIDAVVIASSTDTHLDHCLAAARSGKAVWCEKPLDLDLDRLERHLTDLEPIADRLLLGFQRRFDPTFRTLHARLLAGEIGAIETLHITSHDPAPPPVSYITGSGGIFKDMTIHDFDMARWLLEEPVEYVFASASNLVDPAIGEAGDFDMAKVILRTPSGRMAVISNTRRSGYGYDQRVEAFGPLGRLAANNMKETEVETWTGRGAANDRFENFFLTRYAKAYAAEVDHFVEILAGRQAPVASVADGLGALRLAVAAQQSASIGLPVQLANPA